ncbi:MAG: SAF domain-containing protein, partial [Deltaproteobacteria bacterium]|nr:SAF domain-containing protein [Deltaproteobacteria bacterium]
MNKKALMIIFGSIACGVIAVLLVNFYIKRQEKRLYKGMNMVPVLVMAQDVSANTVLEMGMIAKREVPEKYVHGNAIHPKDAKLITGQILNFPLKRGDTILWTDLGQEEEIKQL